MPLCNFRSQQAINAESAHRKLVPDKAAHSDPWLPLMKTQPSLFSLAFSSLLWVLSSFVPLLDIHLQLNLPLLEILDSAFQSLTNEGDQIHLFKRRNMNRAIKKIHPLPTIQ